MGTGSFSRFAAICALLAGISGILYSGFFVALLRGSDAAATPSAVLLMATGILAVPVVVALYENLRVVEPGFALLGLILGILGATGSFIHGGYDLAVLINPVTDVTTPANAIDPRGLLTFGASAISVFVFARLIHAGGPFPRTLGKVGYVLGTLLVVIYLGRLILLDPNHPVLRISALLAGFIVSPAWYLWLGRLLRRAPESGTNTTSGSEEPEV